MSLGLRFAQWLASKLGQPRIIHGGTGTDMYLSRYYLIGKPTEPNGIPFDQHGDPSESIRWSNLPFGVYLHCFHRSDEDRELHNHPWRFAISLILSGGYMEERKIDRPWPVNTRFKVFRPGMINLISSNTFHRVDLLKTRNPEPTWTLFIVGPKFKGWGFWDRNTGEFMHWRTFLQMKRAKELQKNN